MSKQGYIHRYALLFERLSSRQFPDKQNLLDFMHNNGFEVSMRTLDRDIYELRSEFGVEITWDSYKRGYYISEENSLNLNLFQSFLEISHSSTLIQNKVLNNGNALEYIDIEEQPSLRGIEYLEALLKSVSGNRLLTFTYQSYHDDKPKWFKIQPYLLKKYLNRWYVVGKVPGKNFYNTFGLDRISDLKVLAEKFRRKKDEQLLRNFQNIIGVNYSDSPAERIVLSFTPFQGKYIKSLPLHHSQKTLIDNEEEFRIELWLEVNYELKQKIFSQMDQVEVIEPEWLREDIERMVKRIAGRYGV